MSDTNSGALKSSAPDLLADSRNMTDEEIILYARDSKKCGEAEAVKLNSIIISRYIRLIEIKARQMKNSSLDKDDLVSEGFLGLLSALRSYCHEKGAFRTYAYACIINRMKTAVFTASSVQFRTEDFDFSLIADEMPRAEELLIEKEKEAEVRERLAALLSKREFQVTALYINAYTYKQISEKLGISIKSVDNSLSRARAKLKEMYQKRQNGT